MKKGNETRKKGRKRSWIDRGFLLRVSREGRKLGNETPAVPSNEVKMRNTNETNYIIYATVIFWRDSRVRGVDVLP